MVARAWDLLSELERDGLKVTPRQRMLFTVDSALVEELKRLDVSSMTPLEAITALYELQRRASEEG